MIISKLISFKSAKSTQSTQNSSSNQQKEEKLKSLNKRLDFVNSQLEILEEIMETRSPEYTKYLNEQTLLNKQITAINKGIELTFI